MATSIRIAELVMKVRCLQSNKFNDKFHVQRLQLAKSQFNSRGKNFAEKKITIWHVKRKIIIISLILLIRAFLIYLFSDRLL